MNYIEEVKLPCETEEWFISLIEDLRTEQIERRKRIKFELLEYKFNNGKRLNEDRERLDVSKNKIVPRVGQLIGSSRTDIMYCMDFANRHSTFDEFIKECNYEEGDVPPWRWVRDVYLNKSYDEDKEIEYRKTAVDKITASLKAVIHDREEVQRAVALLTSEYTKQEKQIQIDTTEIQTLRDKLKEALLESSKKDTTIKNKDKEIEKLQTQLGIDQKLDKEVGREARKVFEEAYYNKHGRYLYKAPSHYKLKWHWQADANKALERLMNRVHDIETLKTVVENMLEDKWWGDKCTPFALVKESRYTNFMEKKEKKLAPTEDFHKRAQSKEYKENIEKLHKKIGVEASV